MDPDGEDEGGRIPFSIFNVFSFFSKKSRESGAFTDVFKDMDKFFTMQQGNGTDKKKAGGKIKGKDVNLTLELDFLEAINGVSKSVSFARVNKCSTCEGSKMKPGTKKHECETCSGVGYVTSS